MIKNLILSLILACSFCLGAPDGKILDTSVTNLDNTYAGSENEFIAGGTKNIGNIIVVNNSATDLYGCIFSLAAAACSDDLFIPARSFRTKQSDYIRGLYLRTVSGTESTDIIEGTGE